MIKSKQPDPIYPLLLAFQKAEFCEQIVTRARELSEYLDAFGRLYTQMEVIKHSDSKPVMERIDAEKRKLMALLLKAASTGVTITIQVKTLYEWMNDVREGIILDVFTLTGQQAAMAQLQETADFLQDSLKQVYVFFQQYMDDHLAPEEEDAASSLSSSSP